MNATNYKNNSSSYFQKKISTYGSETSISDNKIKTIRIDEVLNFNKHDGKIIARFLKEYDIDKNVAIDILEATKTFLWLGDKYYKEQNKNLSIFKENYVIDEMWHNYILFTKEYFEFSKTVFGRYIHHLPNIDEGEGEELSEDEKNQKLKDDITFIGGNIGAEKLRIWYLDWPKQYSKNKMHNLKKIT